MNVLMNGKEVVALTDTQKSVIKNDIHADHFDEDMERRVNWVLIHKYEQCFKRLKEEWDQKLAVNGVAMIPTDPEAYAQLVFSQPNYKDRKARDIEHDVSVNKEE